MTEDTFYARFVLNIIVGLMFVYALYAMAKHNNKEQQYFAHKKKRIIGKILIGFCIFPMISLITILSKVQFPSSPFLHMHGIIRVPGNSIFWGYPTAEQSAALLAVFSILTTIGIGLYLVHFRSSNSSFWKKVAKVATLVFLYGLMTSATNLHYFDILELIWAILFIGLWVIIVIRCRKMMNPYIEVEYNQPSTTTEICPSCGAKIKDGHIFCAKCGMRIDRN